MIVEFYGTPGAGKTYLANAIVSQLEKEGIHAENIVELGRSKVKNKAINKVVRVFLRFLPRYKRLQADLRQVAQKYISIPAKYNDEQISGFLDNIIYYSYWYERLRNKKGVYLFDEGIAHQYVNMMANYGVSKADIVKLSKLIPYMPPVVYVTCEISRNLESIKSRNRHVCYIDELTGTDLESCLDAYRCGCELVEDIVSPYRVRREDDIKENINFVCESVGI